MREKTHKPAGCALCNRPEEAPVIIKHCGELVTLCRACSGILNNVSFPVRTLLHSAAGAEHRYRKSHGAHKFELHAAKTQIYCALRDVLAENFELLERVKLLEATKT